MTEITPLLPQRNRHSHDLPIFLRVCHSPWFFLNQEALLAARAIVALCLSIVLALDILYEINHTQRGKQLIFEASNISLMIQMLYYWTTTLWSLKHILTPYGRLPSDEQTKGNFLARMQAGLSAPISTDTNSVSYFVFSTLYTAIVTFPFVISITYWLVLYPLDPIIGRGGKGEALQHFVVISTLTLNSVVAFVEIMVLSSVRKQKDLATQVATVIASYLLYGMWTVVGRFINGEYVYKYFDPDYAGWRQIAMTDVFVSSLTVTVLFAQRGLHTLRDLMAWKLEYDRKGH